MRTFNNKTYRPLPQNLTIKESKIDGLGLHVKEEIEGLNAGTVIGETHVLVHNRDRLEWVRTPLGGFINHSEDPNCFILTNLHDRQLYTIKPIKEGQELTVYYTIGYDDLIQ